jgi:hypothetical protein
MVEPAGMRRGVVDVGVRVGDKELGDLVGLMRREVVGDAVQVEPGRSLGDREGPVDEWPPSFNSHPFPFFRLEARGCLSALGVTVPWLLNRSDAMKLT